MPDDRAARVPGPGGIGALVWLRPKVHVRDMAATVAKYVILPLLTQDRRAFGRRYLRTFPLSLSIPVVLPGFSASIELGSGLARAWLGVVSILLVLAAQSIGF